MKLAADLLKKWFPYGYVGPRQSVPVGLLEECLTVPSAGSGSSTAEVDALKARIDALEATVGLHENNGQHWTEAEIARIAGEVVTQLAVLRQA